MSKKATKSDNEKPATLFYAGFSRVKEVLEVMRKATKSDKGSA
jgi:hypothetical protein